LRSLTPICDRCPSRLAEFSAHMTHIGWLRTQLESSVLIESSRTLLSIGITRIGITKRRRY
jgi:hypothetical protein